jgi:6-phosphogluconolactonase
MLGRLQIVGDVAPSFCAAIGAAWETRLGRRFTIALSGGETARRCYVAVANDPECAVDWMATEVYWGDERCVAPEDPASNFRLAREAFLEQVGGVHALFPMRCADGADAYNLLVSSVGEFDVIHLGLGADGHIASLFPHSPALDADPGRLVVMNADPSGTNEHERMTLTFSGIERARQVIVTVSGAEKRTAFNAVRRGGDVPAARIDGPNVLWIVDHEAAGD